MSNINLTIIVQGTEVTLENIKDTDTIKDVSEKAILLVGEERPFYEWQIIGKDVTLDPNKTILDSLINMDGYVFFLSIKAGVGA